MKMIAETNPDDIGRAKAGRQEATFRRLVEEHQRELHAHCYRMLGSVHDADDAVQDTLLRAWRALPNFRGESSLRTWLYRIATNVCLDAVARRPKRVLPVDYGPPTSPGNGGPVRALPESVWIEPYPDEALAVEDGAVGPEARYERREALELAFVSALQHLPPRQRAVLLLRDVLGFSAKEAAEALETTAVAVNGALRRARAAAEERVPEQTQQATLRALGDRRLRQLVERFADAFEQGKIEAILALLADDATFAMPPYPEWCRGRDAVAKSWLMPGGSPPRLRYAPARANGQPALGAYLLDPEDGDFSPIALDVLTLRGDLIVDVTAFRTPAAFPRFELPDRLPGP
jgi:RNA polymerase sigma-70 factor (ECF subfamily)